ncbi:MAG: chemotaxis protein CheB [Candidatus Eisenbacteria bacterium]
MANEIQPPEAPPIPDETVDVGEEPGDGVTFPVVGVGASAGGLEAFTQLLGALPADTGMAFVLVQHLAPTHPSALAEILSRATKMPVTEVPDELLVEPDHVYVIPPDRSMIIDRGTLQLMKREGPGIHRPVDRFFRALAEDRRHQAIGVVLSGTATDGTLGLEAIKAEGGITFAQDTTAQHDGMPRSAIASGCVDFVMAPDAIAREIVRIGQHPYAVPEVVALETNDKPNLVQVVQLLHHATGVDFTHYKFNTLYRRVTRRMVFHKMNGLAAYVKYLRQTPAEAEALFQDILISVTSFFRDSESFEVLKTTVFPRLLKNRARHDTVRLWTLGCSTGQEAYSLAMAFTEVAEAAGGSVTFQLFATDLNPVCIDTARVGVYSKDIDQDVSPERLRRFFTEVNGSYRISKSVRDACVFSRHNVLADPPFSRMDLISCRNLLIYMEPVLQQKIMPTLHYALKPEGCLWLGASETIGGYRNLFEVEDVKHKIFAKKSGSSPEHGQFPLQRGGAPRSPFVPITSRPSETADLPREADRALLTRFAPPGVVVSAALDILQYRGDTGPFLTPAPGKATLNLLKMLRQGLLVAVRAAVARATQEQAPVREEGLRVKSSGGDLVVAIEVIPLKWQGSKEPGFLVLFDDSSQMSRAARAPRGDAGEGAAPAQTEAGSPDPDNARLAQELAATREYLQALNEQQEAANEELQSANEEVQSANEELQSTNEELETSKEEIQSSNEELATVNDELNNRNVEMNRVNNDLINLLGSVQMAIVMLGPDLRVRRFTPMAEKLLNLIPTDVGRPLADIKLNLEDLPDLEPLLTQALDTVSTRELDVRDRNGRWYSLRLRPYRTQDNKIDGVVVVLVDTTDLKRGEAAVQAQNARLHLLSDAAEALLSTGDPHTMLQGLMQETGLWPGADTYFNYVVDDTGKALRLTSWGGIPDAMAHSIERLDFGQDLSGMVATQRQSMRVNYIQQSDDPSFRVIKSLGLRACVCNPLLSGDLLFGTLSFGSRTRDEFEPAELAVFQTISRYVVVAHDRLGLLGRLHDTDRRKNEFLAMLAHELRNPLAPICNALQILKLTDGKDEAVASASKLMERQIGHMVRLVDDLLDVSRISQGKIELRKERVELALAVSRVVEDARPLFASRNQVLTVDLPSKPLYLNADPTRLTQVLGNLLNNACKYTNPGGRISIKIEREGEQAVIRVRDDGYGLSADQLTSIFDMFMQVDSSAERSGSGLGLGLTLVKELVELHAGTVEVHSPGIGQGSEFIVRLPASSRSSSSRTDQIAAEPTGMTPRRILVVDDNRDAALSLATLLEKSGHETRTAHDGVEALSAAASFLPEVVLLDLGLPNLNGYEVARMIREQPWGQTLKLVAVTGWSQDSARRKSSEAGFDEHLVKPVDIGTLMRLLARTPTGAPHGGSAP